jgi:DNA recombination protein RmuC
MNSLNNILVLGLITCFLMCIFLIGFFIYKMNQMTRLFEALNRKNKERYESLQAQLNADTQNLNHNLKSQREELISTLTQFQTINSQHSEKFRDIMTTHFNQLFQLVTNKLHETIDKKLGESFMSVSSRLDLVHRGLGEMQNLAKSVSDIKNVFQNVKAKGMWGEVQLESLLAQFLAPGQFKKNVNINPRTSEFIEFVVLFPGQHDMVMLPIDAKFPHRSYEKIIEADSKGTAKDREQARASLRLRIVDEAKRIKQKYIVPPTTTDFAILFLPLESLYLEVIQIPGLVQDLQQSYQVIVSGPTTLMALLHSLQVGFKTIAVEKRSAEIRDLLVKVKSDFQNFGLIIEKTHKKIEEAGDNLNLASKKTKQMSENFAHVEWIE